MRTALDFPPETLNAYEQTFVAKISEFGWHHTAVLGDDEGPGFSYTTGFWHGANHPELIMFGVKREIAGNVLWDLFRDAQEGMALQVGSPTDRVFGNLLAYVFPVAKRFYPEYLGSSRWFYDGDEFPCLQIVWPDRAGLFPWQDGFDPKFSGDQPDLTEDGWIAALRP